MSTPLIVQVTETATGGVGRHVRDLLTGLDPARFRQCAVVSYQRTPPDWETGLPWPVRRLDLRRTVQPASDFTAYYALHALLRELQPDLVHAHSSKAGFLARLVARRLGIPAVYTPHVFAFQGAQGLRRSLYVTLERYAAQGGCRIIAVSEAERREALAQRLCSPERIVLIRNGIRATDYLAPPVLPSRGELGLPKDAELLLAVGEYRPQKDYPLLLSALAHLAGRPRLYCALAGLGTEAAPLERLAKRLGLAERLLRLGHRDDLSAWWHAADLLVMTSRYEGCPYALLEAMSAGLPVVAAPAPGVDELVTPAVGLLATDRSPEALADCIQTALSETALTRERAERARARVMEEFAWERMLEQTAAVYDLCLNPST